MLTSTQQITAPTDRNPLIRPVAAGAAPSGGFLRHYLQPEPTPAHPHGALPADAEDAPDLSRTQVEGAETPGAGPDPDSSAPQPVAQAPGSGGTGPVGAWAAAGDSGAGNLLPPRVPGPLARPDGKAQVVPASVPMHTDTAPRDAETGLAPGAAQERVTDRFPDGGAAGRIPTGGSVRDGGAGPSPAPDIARVPSVWDGTTERRSVPGDGAGRVLTGGSVRDGDAGPPPDPEIVRPPSLSADRSPPALAADAAARGDRGDLPVTDVWDDDRTHTSGLQSVSAPSRADTPSGMPTHDPIPGAGPRADPGADPVLRDSVLPNLHLAARAAVPEAAGRHAHWPGTGWAGTLARAVAGEAASGQAAPPDPGLPRPAGTETGLQARSITGRVDPVFALPGEGPTARTQAAPPGTEPRPETGATGPVGPIPTPTLAAAKPDAQATTGPARPEAPTEAPGAAIRRPDAALFPTGAVRLPDVPATPPPGPVDGQSGLPQPATALTFTDAIAPERQTPDWAPMQQAGQIATQVAAVLRPDGGGPQGPVMAQVERDLVLSPPELGRLSIRFEGQADTGQLILQVDRPETLELMRRHLDLLADALRMAGFGGCGISLGGRDPGQARRDGAAGISGAVGGALTDPANPVPPSDRRPATSGRLDLRL